MIFFLGDLSFLVNFIIHSLFVMSISGNDSAMCSAKHLDFLPNMHDYTFISPLPLAEIGLAEIGLADGNGK